MEDKTRLYLQLIHDLAQTELIHEGGVWPRWYCIHQISSRALGYTPGEDEKWLVEMARQALYLRKTP